MSAGNRGLWILVGACFIHVAEERLLNWAGWVHQLTGMEPSWSRFWLINAGFLMFAVSAAAIGWRSPRFSLSLPSLVLINAIFFHIAPTLFLGRISPGAISAVFLYVPLGALLFWRAHKDGLLSRPVIITAASLGAGLMSLPFVLFAVS